MTASRVTTAALAGLLLAMTLAGCAEELPTGTATTTTAVQDRARSLVPEGSVRAEEAAAAPAQANSSANTSVTVPGAAIATGSNTTAPWWLMAVEAAGEGGLAGYTWTIPEGAVKDYKDFDDWQILTLEVAPLLAPDAVVPEFSVWVYRLGSEAELVGSYISVPMNLESRFAVLATRATLQAEARPFLVRIFDTEGDLRPGDQLGFVLQAKGSGTFGAALRVVDADDMTGRASDTSDGMVAQLHASGIGDVLTPFGTGRGSQFAAYLELDYGLLGLTPFGVSGVTMWTDSVTIRHDLPTNAARPFVAVQDITLAASYAGDGWGLGYGSVIDAAAGASLVEFEAKVQGRTAGGTGASIGTPALSLGTAYVLSGDGTGGSSVQLRALTADTNELRFLVVEQADLGASLKHLLGRPAAERDGGSLTVAAEGADLVLTQGSHRQVLAGAILAPPG